MNQREVAAIAALQKVGCPVSEGPDGWKLVVQGDRVKDDDLAVAPDIAGVTALRVEGTSLSAKGVKQLAGLKVILMLLSRS